MRNKIIIKRYAEAFVAFATPRLGIEQIVEEMKAVKTFFRETAALKLFLRAPDVPIESKYAFLDKIFGQAGVSVETRDFIKYLIRKHRIEILQDVADLIRVMYAHGHVQDAVLKTTFPLELGAVERIKAALEKVAGKKVNLYLQLDPDLLGGVQVVMGNHILDGSVRRNLQELKKKLLNTQVV
ncbi:MAG: ATP synthase F1 subunit delta [Candidatus Omnitrophica bacterium]|nr:ATP synthase F1 subunit delta [Candidatus Omnitrophota bacterium]